MAGFFGKALNGAKVPHRKYTENSKTEIMPIPDTIKVIMSQHIGAPCKPLVEPGDSVKVGQVIGDIEAFVSAPIHSSVSGTVKSIEDCVMPNGIAKNAIIIETDKKQEVDESVKPPTITDHASFVEAVRASGMVGLGGAGFPTHIKYNPKNLEQVDTLLINAAECEPYITSDYLTVIEDMDNLLHGIETITKYLGVKRCIIGIEDDKPKAIDKLKEFAAKGKYEVAVLPALYPQGAEKVLIYHTLDGRVVPEGKLPADVGVIVSNITTVATLGNYFQTGMPLVNKRVTIDGGTVNNPKNVLAPIGAEINDVIAFCGGYKSEPKKILLGGPMMGIDVGRDSFPIVKQNNAILALNAEESAESDESACIRCGRCVRSCPMNLMPLKLKEYHDTKDLDALREYKANLCIECGCCAFVCPAKIDLVWAHRDSKDMVKKDDARKAARERVMQRSRERRKQAAQAAKE